VDARARGDVDVDGDDDVVDVDVARVARRVRVARDDDEDGARADGQTRAPHARGRRGDGRRVRLGIARE